LLLEHRTLAEPAARRDAGEGDRLAANRHAADLDQALDDADPVVDRLALAAHEASAVDAAFDEILTHAFMLRCGKLAHPWRQLEQVVESAQRQDPPGFP